MELLEFFQNKVSSGAGGGIDATIKFVLDGTNVIFIDAKSLPPSVSTEDKPADCTIKVASADLKKIISGDMNPMMAFTLGKIKVEGNMGVALNLPKIL
ncbi:MAG: SCP2 sterol-binding domain-containing protein [Bacteroidia bacterium]|nr:SCP2 sterol-binding domain-containing protein [Bacteroidia bacterium]